MFVHYVYVGKTDSLIYADGKFWAVPAAVPFCGPGHRDCIEIQSLNNDIDAIIEQFRQYDLAISN